MLLLWYFYPIWLRMRRTTAAVECHFVEKDE
jgi:hypothetical protein